MTFDAAVTSTLTSIHGASTGLGLLAACVATHFMLQYLRRRFDLRELRSLPESDRADHLRRKIDDGSFAKYKFTLADTPAKDKVALAEKELSSRSVNNRNVMLVFCISFVACFAVAQFAPNAKATTRSPDSLTPDAPAKTKARQRGAIDEIDMMEVSLKPRSKVFDDLVVNLEPVCMARLYLLQKLEAAEAAEGPRKGRLMYHIAQEAKKAVRDLAGYPEFICHEGSEERFRYCDFAYKYFNLAWAYLIWAIAEEHGDGHTSQILDDGIAAAKKAGDWMHAAGRRYCECKDPGLHKTLAWIEKWRMVEQNKLNETEMMSMRESALGKKFHHASRAAFEDLETLCTKRKARDFLTESARQITRVRSRWKRRPRKQSTPSF